MANYTVARHICELSNGTLANVTNDMSSVLEFLHKLLNETQTFDRHTAWIMEGSYFHHWDKCILCI